MMGDAVRAIADAVDGVIGERPSANGSRNGSVDRDDAASSDDEENAAGG
jgi:hypothetical protein